MKAIDEVESAMTAGPCLPGSASPVGGPAKGGRAIVSGALGAAFLAAALAFPAGEAQARDECGALSSGEATCSNQAYASGIRYDVTDGWVNGIAGDITLTVTGGSATAISSAAAAASNSWGSGIVLRTAHHATDTRTVALTVGSGTNAVRITQTTGTLNAGFDNTGVVIHHRAAGASPTTVTLGSGVDIGTMAAPMKRSGVHVLVERADNTADHTITSAADIYSAGFGILMDPRGSGNVVVTNSGSIVNAAVTGGTTGNADGIRILDWTGTRGNERPATAKTTVTNSGSISVSQAGGSGIRVDAEGLGLYKTVNSGTVSATSTASHGIFVDATHHWGAAGSEAVEIENSGAITTASTSTHGIYVETYDGSNPQGRGDGNLAITNSGSISSANAALLVNSNMGDTTVKHTGGSLTSTADDGIRVQQGGTGAVTVESSADVTAENYGIRVLGGPTQAATTVTVAVAVGVTTRTNEPQVTIASGTTTTTYATLGDVSVTHSAGTISAETESGIWIQQKGADATVTSSADVTAKKYGIFVVNDRALATVAIAAGVTTRTWSNTGAVSVTHSAGTISAETESGIWVRQVAGTGAVTVISSSDVTAAVHGIYVGNEGTGDTRITTTGGKIMADADGIHLGIAASNTSGGTIDNAAAITAKGYGLVAWYAGEGEIRIENSGVITAENTGIHADEGAAGAITIVNGADVTGDNYGVFARNTQGGGAVTVTHSAGIIHGKAESGIAAWIGRWQREDDADSPAPISTATVRVEVTGGSVKASETRNRVAIAALNHEGGSAEVSVSKGATLSAKHNAGIYTQLADRQNTAGQIKVTQGGTIEAYKGVYASVPRASAADEAPRDAMRQPLIDVTWTGTFTESERTLTTLNLNGVAHAIESAQEVQAGEVFRGAAHTAGIDAEVLSWRVLNRIATRGDDPGEIADAAAQAALLDTASTDAAVRARAEYILKRFRSVLTNRTLGTIPGAAAINTDGTTGLSDDEIKAYLMEDSDARRTLLRDVLARDLSAAEQAVLQALVTDGGDLDAALDDDAGFSARYKDSVRGLLDRFNVGNIRVAMNGGSIDSGGDGIRAWYARQHDRNGAISVTVAEGASVTGGEAGVYVANAGAGLRIAKKYLTPAAQDENEDLEPDDLVTLADYLNQVVRVDGTVTGGKDAAVHLDGGGALIVGRTGRLVAGSSGQTILVNDPGPAIIWIEGQVRGGAGREAAVDLTGGGGLTVGATGRVEANGATSAIRTDGSRTDLVIEGEVKGSAEGEAAVHLAGGGTVTIRAPTRSGAAPRVDANGAMWAIQGNGVRVDITTTGNVQDPGVRKSAADAAVKGSVGPDVRAAVVQLNDAGDPTGHSQGLPLTPEGEFDPSSFTPVPTITVTASVTVMASVTTMAEPTTVTVPSPTQPTQTQPLFECERASDRRCELYEALPSVLLTMNGMLSYAERSSAARDANGGWARVEGARGKWEAKKASSTTGRLSYDHRRGGVRAGVDLGAGEHGRVGVSAHLLNGKAERAGVGDVEVDGMGAGASATWRWGEWYVDAQAGATWYEVGVDHRESGVLVKEADGLGYAMEVEAGRGMAMGGGLVVTPRVGLAWSKVGMDDFTFTSKVGTQETVSVEDAHSARGRLGVLVEAEVGMGERSGRLFGSLDVEQEFSDETRVDVGATSLTENALKTEVRPTTLRLGVGGMLGLGEDMVLRGTAGYETSGSGTSEYGVGVQLNARF